MSNGANTLSLLYLAILNLTQYHIYSCSPAFFNLIYRISITGNYQAYVGVQSIRLLSYNLVSMVFQERCGTRRVKLLSIVRTPGRGQGDSQPVPRLSPTGTWAELGTFSSRGRVYVRSAISQPSILRSLRGWSEYHLVDLGYRSRLVHEEWIRNTVLRLSSQPKNTARGQRIFVEEGQQTQPEVPNALRVEGACQGSGCSPSR